METAKIFKNGRSQAVRLPKDCRFSTEDVYIKKINNIVILIPKNKYWDPLLESLDMFSDDFMEERKEPKNQKRENL